MLWLCALLACGRVSRRPECPEVLCTETLTADGGALADCYGWTEDGGWPVETPLSVWDCEEAGPCSIVTAASHLPTVWWCGCQPGSSKELVPSDCCEFSTLYGSKLGQELQARLQEDCGLEVPVRLTCEDLPPELPLEIACE